MTNKNNVYRKYRILDAKTGEEKHGKYFVLKIDAKDEKEREWYRSAKHLYTTAIHAMKAYYAWTSEPENDWKDLKEMHRQFRLLHKALTRLNYGYDPLAKGGAK